MEIMVGTCAFSIFRRNDPYLSSENDLFCSWTIWNPNSPNMALFPDLGRGKRMKIRGSECAGIGSSWTRNCPYDQGHAKVIRSGRKTVIFEDLFASPTRKPNLSRGFLLKEKVWSQNPPKTALCHRFWTWILRDFARVGQKSGFFVYHPFWTEWCHFTNSMKKRHAFHLDFRRLIFNVQFPGDLSAFYSKTIHFTYFHILVDFAPKVQLFLSKKSSF